MTKTVAQGPNRRGEPTREKVEQPSEKVEQPSEISLSVPWITGSSNINIANVFQDGRGNDEIMGMFIKERTRVHETYIKETGSYKNFWIRDIRYYVHNQWGHHRIRATREDNTRICSCRCANYRGCGGSWIHSRANESVRTPP